MPHFTITSTHKGHSQLAVLLSLTATLLFQSGALLSPRRIHALNDSDARADLSDSTVLLFAAKTQFNIKEKARASKP